MIGFKKLTAEGYAYAPRLKAISTGVNNTQVADPRAMPNGYIIYIFMDLLSGESLTRDKFDRCDKNEREEIRKALRAALE